MKKLIVLVYALILCLSSVLFMPANVQAQKQNPYFDYTYTVELNQTSVNVNEPFTARVHGQGTCKESLPMSISKGIVSGRVFARLQQQSLVVDLNPNFQMELDKIPDEVGQSFEKNIDVPLVFPAGSPPGKYDVIAQTTGAEFQVLAFWISGLSYLPTEPISVGTIELKNNAAQTTATITTPTASNTPTPPTTDTHASTQVTPVNTITKTGDSPATQVPVKDRGIWQKVWPIAGILVVVGAVLSLVIWRTKSQPRDRKK